MRYPDGTAPPRKEGNIKLWTTFLSMLVKSGHSHFLKSLKRQILPPSGNTSHQNG